MIRPFFDATWYLSENPDVAAAGLDPLEHYVAHGVEEGRAPNPFFDAAWYLAQNPDVQASGVHPLMHYMNHGAAELRNPHPRFDAAFYADEHPDSAGNPLLYHMVVGRRQGWATEPRVDIADWLASPGRVHPAPEDIAVDVIVPVYRGLEQTRRCLLSVIEDPERLPGNLIVIDDRSPEPKLSAWLDRLDGTAGVRVLRNKRNLGFVGSTNRGIEAAGRHDVVLLNSDTEVPPGWLRRLAGHAYAAPRIGTVSPLSNNATICSYPSVEGGPLPLGFTLGELDAAASSANAGRAVEVPTTVGFCMYIRRACIDEVGLLDAETFGRGYAEENDFCMRAAIRGWSHRLACDTFVYHEGEVSFGAKAPELEAGRALLVKRYPSYPRQIERHVRRDAAGPARFALTAALFRASGVPTVLMVSHALGGGVRRHVDRLVERLGRRANVLLLDAAPNGVALSVPAMPGHPVLTLAADRVGELLEVLRAQRIARVHVHHVVGLGIHLRALIHALGVPFDFTVHDYYTICPQINLLPQLDQQYCGEPGPAGCNACIAQRTGHGARDILSWRREHAWLLTEAARVLCPSEDVRTRMLRYGARNTVFAPHDKVARGPWRVAAPPLPRGRRLRVAVLGVLAQQKGAATVAAVAEAADPTRFEFHLIGYPEQPLPAPAAARITATGAYQDPDLPALIAQLRPHVVWFPAQWPETYSYTLSAALDAGLPVLASEIGAFPERLEGRPLTWLVAPAAPASDWIEALSAVRAELAGRAAPPRPRPRRAEPDFYADDYIVAEAPTAKRAAPAPSGGPIDLRRPGRLSVVVVPERFDGGILSPCAYIRLLLPLDHPAIGADIDLTIAEAGEALRYRADVVATHRYAITDAAVADALVRHCRETGARLLYDLDDDLLNIPRQHPEAAILRPRARVVELLARQADAVWVSTAGLRDSIAPVRPDALLVENGLDERLWCALPQPRAPRGGPLRVLLMGTMTHGDDLATILPALARIAEEHPGRVTFDVIGMTADADLPAFLSRVEPPPASWASYPGFVNWITGIPGWDVGLTPLADTGFNAAKSAIKTMDYAALGLAVLASDVPAYRGSIADGPGGFLVPNTAADWYWAITRLMRDPRLREELATGARAALLARHTLHAQAKARRAAWLDLSRPPAAAPARRERARRGAAA